MKKQSSLTRAAPSNSARGITCGRAKSNSLSVLMKTEAKRAGITVLSLTLLSSLASTTAWGMFINPPNGANYSDYQSPCLLDNGSHCYINSYLSTQPLNSGDPFFAQALSNWNAGKPAAEQWSIVQGGALPGILLISEFYTFDENYSGTLKHDLLGQRVGGVEIVATYVPAASNDPLESIPWYWAQAVSANYASPPSSHLSSPGSGFTTMDDAIFSNNTSSSYWGLPVYPVQDGPFYDAPHSPDHLGYDTYFHAANFLVTLDAAENTLTVYQGVSYGWDIYCVPEPSPLVLLGIGAVSLFAYARRREAQG